MLSIKSKTPGATRSFFFVIFAIFILHRQRSFLLDCKLLLTALKIILLTLHLSFLRGCFDDGLLGSGLLHNL